MWICLIIAFIAALKGIFEKFSIENIRRIFIG
jgi:hypothetical protein